MGPCMWNLTSNLHVEDLKREVLYWDKFHLFFMVYDTYPSWIYCSQSRKTSKPNIVTSPLWFSWSTFTGRQFSCRSFEAWILWIEINFQTRVHSRLLSKTHVHVHDREGWWKKQVVVAGKYICFKKCYVISFEYFKVDVIFKITIKLKFNNNLS
jgi:hypothetical protein